ncbi:MAG: hypothetical protein ACLTZI_15975 [[Eubacterium] siraeum]
MNNRYSISNDMSERPISLLKEKLSVSESHEIKYDSKNAYCLLMNEIETDNLYQDDELNNKFYGVFSDTADDEFLKYIFVGEKKKIFGCVIASVSGNNITAKLGIQTLSKAISQHPWVLKNGIILHSDRGSQYTSRKFTDYSLLASEGINIQEIARRLGHSNVEMTWNTYSHLYPHEEERAIKCTR